MKNIYLISSDIPVRYYGNRYVNQNVYITSEDDILDGDAYIENGKYVCPGSYNIKPVPDRINKKIILATDTKLIEEGVQEIDEEFLKWIMDNPTCDWVNTILERYLFQYPDVYKSRHKILIPKEEPKMNKLQREIFEMEQELGVPSHLRWHNTKSKQESNIVRLPTYYEPKKVLTEEDIWSKEDIDAVTDYINKETLSTKLHKGEVVDESYPKEFKQETLEEVAERFVENWFENGDRTVEVFKAGAKWQMEKSYSEEEVKELLETQRGNCYVAVLMKTKNDEIASIALTAPEPGGKNGTWIKNFTNK
jgi:hypothetical protein